MDSPQVYAIRYSSRAAQAAEHFYRNAPCDGDMPMAYYVWLIRTGAGNILFDTGYTQAKAGLLKREFVADPLATVRELGVEHIDHLVLSHFHFDHTGRIGEVPEATIHVQRREMEFWFGPYAGIGEYPSLCDPEDLANIVRANVAGRVHWLDGDAEILPGVTAHLVGGHTPGSQVLRVETDAGPVVLAADASHFYANYESQTPYAILHTVPLMYEAFKKLAALAAPTGVVVPGHDPRVMDQFQPVTEESRSRVVRIA